ncbi:hypothetical protein EZV62_012019 [Acer yangbiense]|uniref:Uncharacterized protein n=1 Tax=Acer yangbiense TaxID=1000413 RepID=A0A5C7I798_9ROSI|nr:hypothetical protein EZV62_012019 [Acer yangbiense]
MSLVIGPHGKILLLEAMGERSCLNRKNGKHVTGKRRSRIMVTTKQQCLITLSQEKVSVISQFVGKNMELHGFTVEPESTREYPSKRGRQEGSFTDESSEWTAVDYLKLPFGNWNDELVVESFCEEEAEAILSLPPCASAMDDISHGMKLDVVCLICLKHAKTTFHTLWLCHVLLSLRSLCGLIGDVSSIGVVIRDSQGHVRASLCQKLNGFYQPKSLRPWLFLRGLVWLLILDVPFSEVGVVVQDILNLLIKVNGSVVSFVTRLANKVAHMSESVWLDDCPLSVESLILGDYPSYL